MKWHHYAGAVALLVVGYFVGVWYPQFGVNLKAKLMG